MPVFRLKILQTVMEPWIPEETSNNARTRDACHMLLALHFPFLDSDKWIGLSSVTLLLCKNWTLLFPFSVWIFMMTVSKETNWYEFCTWVTQMIMRYKLIKGSCLNIVRQRFNVEFKNPILLNIELIEKQHTWVSLYKSHWVFFICKN